MLRGSPVSALQVEGSQAAAPEGREAFLPPRKLLLFKSCVKVGRPPRGRLVLILTKVLRHQPCDQSPPHPQGPVSR